MMKDLIKELHEKEIFVSVTGQDLNVKFNGAKIPEELVKKIRDNKEQLVDYLLMLNRYMSDNDIQRSKEQPSYPMSSAQKRLWIVSQFNDANVAYNMPGSMFMEGDLNLAIFTKAFLSLIERHEMLRTNFRTDDKGEIRQFIRPMSEVDFRISGIDLRSENNALAINDIVSKEVAKPFNLANDFLLRCTLCRVENEKWFFIYTMHHIISDAWSMKILVKELVLIYNALLENADPLLSPLTIQYKDYASWQQEQLSKSLFKTSGNFWLKQFEGDLPVLSLPSDHSRPAYKTFRGACIKQNLSDPFTGKMIAKSQEKGATLFMYLLSAVNVLFYKYTGQQDFIIGHPVAGREHPELHNQIGFYVNVLPLRTQFKSEDTFNELLLRVRDCTQEAYRHQMYPFDVLVGELNLPIDLSRSVLFDVLIDFSHLEENISSDIKFRNIKVREHDGVDKVTSKFDLTFYFIRSGKGLQVVLEYNTDIYGDQQMKRLLSHFYTLLGDIADRPDIPLHELKYLDADETSLLNRFQSGAPVHVQDTMLVWIEKHAKETPDKTAVVFNKKEIRYGQLNERSNQLANHFIECYGVKKGDLVGLLLERSDNTILAVLAVLKAGAAFVPIDVNHPRSRKEYIVSETAIRLLITQSEFVFDIDYYGGSVFAIDIQLESVRDASTTRPPLSPGLEDTCYVLYTSGTTGNPKGCILSHRNLSNYVGWANNFYFGNVTPSFGFYTSLSFDFTLTGIFCTLTEGGTITVFPDKMELVEIFRESFNPDSIINSVKLTPSHIQILASQSLKADNVRTAIVGGEAMAKHHVEILKEICGDISVYNEYGPTEATVGCIVSKVELNEPVTIGRPIANTQIFILDHAGKACPVGVDGEICIAGDSVGQGYLKQRELTAARFIDNPVTGIGILYRTGDIGKWNEAGDIIYLGRKDNQVKIRGHRVELDEIESVLRKYPQIASSLSMARRNQASNVELIAYVVGAGEIRIPDLRNFISTRLPSYMVPDHFIFLKEFPLTINGKIDTVKLPGPSDSRVGMIEYVAPENDVQRKLIEICKEVFDKEKIGIHDNFFDLGGNSLKLVQLSALINQHFGKSISIVDLFNSPNVAAVSAFLNSTEQNNEWNTIDKDIDRSNSIMEQTLSLLNVDGNEK